MPLFQFCCHFHNIVSWLLIQNGIKDSNAACIILLFFPYYLLATADSRPTRLHLQSYQIFNLRLWFMSPQMGIFSSRKHSKFLQLPKLDSMFSVERLSSNEWVDLLTNFLRESINRNFAISLKVANSANSRWLFAESLAKSSAATFTLLVVKGQFCNKMAKMNLRFRKLVDRIFLKIRHWL